jgi:hypothetical protein
MSATLAEQSTGELPFLHDIPLFWIGKNIEFSGKESKGNCFFEVVHKIREPYITYKGGPFEGYTLYFKIQQASGLTFELVRTLNSLLKTVVGLSSIPKPTQGDVTAALQAVNNLQDRLDEAMKEGNIIPVQKEMPVSGETFTLSNPKSLVYGVLPTSKYFKNGNIAIYVRLGASMILNSIAIGGDITPGKVLANDEVGGKRCIQSYPIADKDCTTTRQTFRQAYKAAFKADQERQVRFFDLSDTGIKKVYEVCDRLRKFPNEDLQLPTLDALLLRWAAIKESGLNSALADPKQLDRIAKASEVTSDALKDICWNKVDQEVLEGVAKEMNMAVK